MRGGTAPKFSPYFFPLSRSRLKIEKSTQYHGTVENREQRAGQNTPEKAASQFESCLRNQIALTKHIRPENPENNLFSGFFRAQNKRPTGTILFRFSSRQDSANHITNRLKFCIFGTLDEDAMQPL